MNEKGASPGERAAFVDGALMAVYFAKLSVDDMTTVLKKMLITPDEVWERVHALDIRRLEAK